MSDSEQVAIRCTNLSKTYGEVDAVKCINLVVPQHSIFGLLGPNGAGKSTTIKLLTRQIAPTSGQAWVAEAPITGHSRDVRNQIGYLGEQPAVYSWMSGREFLDFVGELFKLKPEIYRKRRDELLALVGLKSAAKRRIGGYSNGMRQRLGIAQALMNNPRVLILDEPVSALDPLGRKEILELLANLRGQTTIFFSSHILEDVDRICDEVAILNRGSLLIQASTTRLKKLYTRSLIKVEMGADPRVLVDLLSQEAYVQRVEVEGEQVSIFVRDVAEATYHLPAILAQTNSPLLHYEVCKPTLEDVFVQLVEETTSEEN